MSITNIKKGGVVPITWLKILIAFYSGFILGIIALTLKLSLIEEDSQHAQHTHHKIDSGLKFRNPLKR